MKKFMCLLVFCLFGLFFAGGLHADSLVSDPKADHVGVSFEIWQAAKGLTDTQVVATGKLVVSKTMEADGSIKYVLDSLVPGNYNWYIRAFGSAYVYGPANTQGGSSVYSVFIPFDFTKRTVASGSITGLKLVP
jgi:hypothetical protein